MPNGDQPRYDTHDYAGDRADDISIAMRNMPEEDRSSNADLQRSITESQREALAPQVEMGDDRVVVPQNWESRTSTELYAAATDKNVPTSADGLGRGFTEGGNRLAEAANRLLDAVTRLEHAWQGEAADAARNALTPLAQRTGQAGIAAQYMGTAMSDQAIAAATVRNMPEPVEFDRDAELTRALANPNPVAGMADMQAKEQHAKAVKAEQVKYLNTYQTTMAEIDARTPTFVPPPPRSTDTGGGQGFQGGARVSYTGPGGSDGFTPRGGSGSGGSGFGFVPGNQPTNPGQVTPLPGVGVDTGTDISGYTPPSTSPVQPPVTANPTPSPTPQPSPTGGGGPFTPIRGGGGPAAPTGGRPATGVPRGPLGGGSGGAGGSGAGAKPGAGAGAGLGQGGRGGPGAAGRPGGPAAGSGGRGTGMGAGAGGRGGQGDEDTEHQRPSYLVEPDPEDTFGTDQITAPPVIGE